jgi:hypothetical protein
VKKTAKTVENVAKPQTLIRWPDDLHRRLEEWAKRNGLALSTMLAKYISDNVDDITGTNFRLVRDGGPLGTLASPEAIPMPGRPMRARLSKDRVTKNPYAELDDTELAMLKAYLGGEAAFAKFDRESEPLTTVRGRQIVDRLKREAAEKRGGRRRKPKALRRKWDPERIAHLRQRVADGATHHELEKEFEVGESGLRQMMWREGIRFRARRRKVLPDPAPAVEAPVDPAPSEAAE